MIYKISFDLLGDESPAEYHWVIICHTTELLRTTSEPRTDFTFTKTGCFISVTVAPSVGNIQNINESVGTFLDFSLGEFFPMEMKINTRVNFIVPGNFPPTGMTFVWTIVNDTARPYISTQPQLISVFRKVGYYEMYVDASNEVKNATVKTTFVVFGDSLGMSNYLVFHPINCNKMVMDFDQCDNYLMTFKQSKEALIPRYFFKLLKLNSGILFSFALNENT